jgi:glycerophosphoryl diester phosphodiesterase
VARAAGAADRLWLCYHDWRPMAAWRRRAPEAHLVESTNLAWMGEGLDARVSALAGTGVDAVNLHRSQWDRAIVGAVHAGGLAAFAWDAQSRPELDAVLALGVDAVYSDHVDRMMAAVTAAP